MLFLNTHKSTSVLYVAGLSLCWLTSLSAQQREALSQPVYRVGNTTSAVSAERTSIRPQLDGQLQPATVADAVLPANANPLNKHPDLLRALGDAGDCLANLQNNVEDYKCVLIRREQVKGKLLPPEYIQLKVRQRKTESGKTIVPFSVYMKFLKPDEVKGREILYVEGQFNGKMLVKEGGGGFRSKLPAMKLSTTNPMVMKTCRYPISDVGVENLTKKLIERGGANDGNVADVDYTAQYTPGAKLNGQECNYLKIDFMTRKPVNESRRLEIFIDSVQKMPIRYVSYDWPKAEGAAPEILEEYSYLNIETNNGFTAKDFDRYNPTYNF